MLDEFEALQVGYDRKRRANRRDMAELGTRQTVKVNSRGLRNGLSGLTLFVIDQFLYKMKSGTAARM